MTAIKERPILFSAPMVNAIRAGRKTQTRRLMKPQPEPEPGEPGKHWWPSREAQTMISVEDELCGDDPTFAPSFCPHGGLGDRLYVKEGLVGVFDTKLDGETMPIAAYAADRSHAWEAPPDGMRVKWVWKRPSLPSIHMPRRLARVFLEITDVRVERLNDISEADAIAEGLDVKTCERVFRKAAGRARQEFGRWLEYENGGEPATDGYGYWCLDCVGKAASRHKAEVCGWNDHFESDGVPYCEDCGVQLYHSLTKYGVDQALYLTEEDELFRPHFPMSGDEALALAELASGMGDLQSEHHGRMAQIAFATLWESIHGKGSWAANPFVWAITFRRIVK